MRLYIIGFMVGVIGLVAANQVRAEEGAYMIACNSSITSTDGSGEIINRGLPCLSARR
jgi:hypothetical protein